MPSENLKVIAYSGGWVCLALMIYSILTMLIVFIIGGPPESVEENFSFIAENRFIALLRLDILTVFVMPLYYILFYSLYKVMQPVNNGWITISFIFIFAGVTLFLAAPSTFTYLHLADGFGNAVTETERSKFLSAGEAVMAADIWHGASPQIGGILVQAGAFIISVFMLKGNTFSKLTAYIGIIMHGFDLAHIITAFFSVVTGQMLMIIAGPLYPLWFMLVGIELFKFGRKTKME